MIFHIIAIIILLLLFVYISYRSYEGFNTSYKQSNYTPNTNIPLPLAADKVTNYLSPDKDGNCPGGYERDKNNVNSLCHTKCKEDAKFYVLDDVVHGCVILNTSYNVKDKLDASNNVNTYPYAKDNKTNIVSPKPNGSCPKNFKLDTRSGFCHTECIDNTYTFYGDLGCLIFNKEYPQTEFGNNDKEYPTTEDGNNLIVSPTSSGVCPEGFNLDYASGLCHTPCEKGTFYGTKSGSKVTGCR